MFGDQYVSFFTDDKVNALWYGGTTDNVRAMNVEMNKPYVFNANDGMRLDLKISDEMKYDYNDYWNERYNKFEKELKNMGEDKLSEHIKKINPELQYFWYYLKDAGEWYYDLVSVKHWYWLWHIISYSLETVNELFEYGEINELMPREDDQSFTTDDLVKYVLMKNEKWDKYDGVIINNVIDSTNMAWWVANDYIIFNSKQAKPVKWEIDWN